MKQFFLFVSIALLGLALQRSMAQQPGGGMVGPGGTFGPTVMGALYPMGQGPLTFTQLPACNAAFQGSHAWISNSPANPVWGAAAVGGGAVFAAVQCIETAAATFAWVNDYPAGGALGPLTSGLYSNAVATPVAFASLPACAAANAGTRAWINNGPASPAFNAAAAGGGVVFTPVLCSYTAASTFTWVNG